MTETESNLVIPIPSKEEMKPTFPYMEKLVKASKVINMWPNTKKTNCFLYHSLVCFIVTLCVLVILSFGIQIRKDYRNLDSIAVLVDFLTVFVSGTFRYIYIYVRGDKYLLLVSQIHNNFIHFSLFPNENRGSMMKFHKMATKLITVYSSFTCFWVLQICTMPIFTYIWQISNLPADLNDTLVEPVRYPIPMKTYAPFEYYYEQPGNAFFYAFQFCCFMAVAWIYVVVDCFWYMVILLTIGQFVLLKESIDTLSEIVKKESSDELQPLKENETREVFVGLQHCIKQHQFMREFVRLVDDINNPNILVDSLHAVISIGFILLDVIIALNTGDWNKGLYSVEYLLTSIVHMFFFDWLGNQLTVKEEELADAIYDVPWDRCPKLKPLVILMLIQARRPCQLTGGRMYKLSLQFFTTMIRAVFSYFTFLLQMRNGRQTK